MKEQKYKKSLYYFLFLFFAVLAVFIRVWRFGEVPGGMNQDGAMAAVDAKALAEYGTDRLGMKWPVHLTAWGFGQMSALLSYLMMLPVRLWGLSVFSARLPMLLVSLASLAVLGIFAAKNFERPEALAILAAAAICPWHILQSRWALDCNLFPHFLLAGIAFLVRGAEKKKGALYISMVFFALSMYCYGIAIYTVPLLLLAACVYLLCRGQIKLRQAIAAGIIYLLIAWPFIACMVINTFGLKSLETPLFTVPYFPYSMRSNDILFFSKEPLRQLGRNCLSLLTILLQKYDGAICNEVRGFGTLYPLSLPFMIWGMVVFFRRFRKSTACAMTVLWFLTAVFSGLITANVNINRINILFYPLILFTGTGLAQCLKRLWRLKKLRWAGRVIPAAYLAAFLLFAHTYFTGYAEDIANAFMQDFGRAVSAVKGSDAEKVYISADAQYPGYAHVSEILTLFYLDTDAQYYQSDAFRERFTFRIPEKPDDSESAVYVAAAWDLPRFSDEAYSKEAYGKFYVVKPKY